MAIEKHTEGRERRRINRREFLGAGLAGAAAFAMSSPIGAFGLRVALGQTPPRVTGYGPLEPRGDLALPRGFDYAIISWQGMPMSDGRLTPGIFDAMGAFPLRGHGGRRIALIRNHENRERPGEAKVVVPPELEYDAQMYGGCTKLVVELDGRREPRVVESFAVLGGTSTNCAGGVTPWGSWITCEEVVKRGAGGRKHGYIFEIDARADGPVEAIPVPAAGRLVHEAAAWHAGILYLTEDRSIEPDPVLGEIGACFYRYIPSRRPRKPGDLASSCGRLEALKIRGEHHANMDVGRIVGVPYDVEWVPIDDPDHEDDTDSRKDRMPGFIPTRIQAQDKGAAYFDRQEGMWVGDGKIYFDCTTGGSQNLGQVWEYDPRREKLTLIYESTRPETLENPDNMVVVPQTGDIFLCEDSPGEQYIRGLTPYGEIYDFARTLTNDSEFCGACFDPSGRVLFVNQQGERGDLPNGPAGARAVTYAIWGPFERRSGARTRSFSTYSLVW